jgi:5-methylcytosine-specific restriction endonuclease McrA
MARGRTTDNTEYRNNRAALLKGQPLCHWCQRKTADTADHLVEVDRGGDNSLSNLVPACRECNSRRGTQYKSARDRQRIHDRAEATRTIAQREPILYTDTPSPDRKSVV